MQNAGWLAAYDMRSDPHLGTLLTLCEILRNNGQNDEVADSDEKADLKMITINTGLIYIH